MSTLWLHPLVDFSAKGILHEQACFMFCCMSSSEKFYCKMVLNKRFISHFTKILTGNDDRVNNSKHWM